MAKGRLSFLSITDKKSTLTAVVLVGNVFAWYYAIINLLGAFLANENTIFGSSEEILSIWIVHFLGIIFSALLGTGIRNKIGGRRNFLVLWMGLGVVASFALMLPMTGMITVMTVALVLGVSLGLGMPNCMGYFTDKISVENRGKIGGITILFSGLGMLLLNLFLDYSLIIVSLILVLWRFSALSLLLVNKSSSREIQKRKLSETSYRQVISQQSFILYFVPWIMFSLVNYLGTYIEIDVLGQETFALFTIFETGLTALFALLGGFFMDSIGRKRVAIIGFAMLGVGYAGLGLYPDNPISWYFNIFADGIDWGLFFVIFVVTIWGDLSHTAPSDKYYAIGVLPFFVSKLLELLIGGEIANLVSPNTLFSFVAFFLFLAVLPLVYAPETLPEKRIRERELNIYIERAKKAKEKYA